MPSYLTRNGRVTALIRRTLADGTKQSDSKTFATLNEAKFWAANFSKTRKPANQHDPYLLSLRDIYRLKRHPSDHAICGIYFLFSKNTCIYVGQSRNIPIRIRDHQNPGSGTRGFDRFAYIEVPPESLNTVETHYIVLLNPIHNIIMNPKFR